MEDRLTANLSLGYGEREMYRFSFLYVLLLAVTGLLLGRSFYLQVIAGTGLRAAAESNRVAAESLTAPRGIVYDTQGTQLVENIASTDLVVDPTFLPPEEHEAELIERLPELIKSTPQEIQERIHHARAVQRTIVLARALDHDSVLHLEELLPTLPGLRLNSSLVRKYPFDKVAAHVLGYTSAITADELEAGSRGLLPTDITGKTGLEKQYDEALHGRHGAVYREVDVNGRPRQELGSEPATAGSDLHVSVDIELQKYIFQLLQDRAEAGQTDNKEPVNGAVLALDPRTGSIRALVSFPSFDPNVFSQPALVKDASAFFSDPQQPLYNRVTDGTYAPGSTIKPVIAAAALQEDIITSSTTVQSTGGLTIGSWHFPDWKSGGHGPTNVSKALAESVNTFFYLASGGDETRSGLGPEKITDYLAMFDWGQQTGIDLPTEGEGLLPTPAWKEATKHEQWYIGDTYHLGIGQGDVMATPLQVAVSTMALANGGTIYTPHMVEEMRAPDMQPRKMKVASKRVQITPANLELVRAGLRQAVTEGSAKSLSTLGLALAGKTGTAQIGGTDKTHAWFTSFGPYETPQLVVTVLLEQGGGGDTDAVPLARDIWQWWYEHRFATDTPS